MRVRPKSVWILILAGVAAAADPTCTNYPASSRQLDLSRLQLQRGYQAIASRPVGKPIRRLAAARNNFIDDYIFGKMEADGVTPAPVTGDAEFLRRVMLDLTGRVPTAERIQEFLASENPNKREELVDELVGSEAYIDYWTFFYANLFEVTGRYYNLIGVPGRNLFYRYLRDFVSRDRSYGDVAAEMIGASGDSYVVAPMNFLIRGFQQGDPVQDTWDTITDRVTTRFLGVKTECISCHDGRRHLEQINLYLTERRRDEFMRLSAFFSRMNMTFVPVDAFNQNNKTLVSDRMSGGYHGVVNSNNPGPRPPRLGGPYDAVYMFNGGKPKSDEWRRELGQLITADRQFARVAVNYLWAHLFTTGIVDPPDAWDLRRLDPKNPPSDPGTLPAIQPSHPELLERLADEFISSGFRIRPMLRLMALSAAYQLSSTYEREWQPGYTLYFARHVPRRLLAEEIHDAMAIATNTVTPMYVTEWDQPVMFATQLPDPTEPQFDNSARSFLANFGRGDWWRLPRSSNSTVLQVLYMMNDFAVNNRTFASRGGFNTTSRVGQLMQSPMSDEDAVKQLFLATVGRNPNAQELAVAMSRRGTNRENWLSDVQWALLNSLGFLFNH